MAKTKPFYSVAIDKDDMEGSVERLASSVVRVLNGLAASEIISGSLITDVDLGTTAVRVAHKLGRKPLGYIVIRRDSDATVFEQVEDREDFFLNLKASATVRVNLWVF